MDCLKRKQRKRREQKNQRLSPHISPTHSQPSTLGNTANGGLPKVSSTGLWRHDPSVFAVNPSPIYFYGRPYGSLNGLDHPHYMSRAISETRIPQPGHSFPLPRPHLQKKEGIYFWPVHGQRFYHSQQMTPVYEVPPTMGMEIYSYPPYPGGAGGPRSRLLETRHTPQYFEDTSQFMMKSRVERKKSDADNRKPAKPLNKKEVPGKNISSPRQNGELSRSINTSQKSLEDDERKLLKSVNSQKSNGGVKTEIAKYETHVNKAFTHDSVVKEGILKSTKPVASTLITVTHPPLQNGTAGMVRAFVPGSENISTSTTDSMKMLAKNKTDDQKTNPLASFSMYNGSSIPEEVNKENNIRYYTYQDDIYSIPNKNNNNEYDNPLVTRMKEMVVERSRRSNTSFSRNDLVNPYATSSSLNDTSSSKVDTVGYQEVTSEIKIIKTKVTESLEIKDTTDSINLSSNMKNDLVLPDNLNTEENSQRSTFKALSQSEISEPSTTDVSKWNKSEVFSNGVLHEHKKDVVTNGKDIYDSTDDDGQIATSAFKFLDVYLTDDDGTESHVESPPLSPGGFRMGTVF